MDQLSMYPIDPNSGNYDVLRRPKKDRDEAEHPADEDDSEQVSSEQHKKQKNEPGVGENVDLEA